MVTISPLTLIVTLNNDNYSSFVDTLLNNKALVLVVSTHVNL